MAASGQLQMVHKFVNFDGTSFLVLTSGFMKKQQKTPLREIELARERRTGYLQQKEQL
jgi:phage-related protein